MPARTTTIRPAYVAAIVGIICGVWTSLELGSCRSEARARSKTAVALVGMAALAYFDDVGVPPSSLGDLSAMGYLCTRGEDTEIWIRGASIGGAPKHLVDAVRLSFPASKTPCDSPTSATLEEASRVPRFIDMAVPSDRVVAKSCADVNRQIVDYWAKICRGELTGEPVLDFGSKRCGRQ